MPAADIANADAVLYTTPPLTAVKLAFVPPFARETAVPDHTPEVITPFK